MVVGLLYCCIAVFLLRKNHGVNKTIKQFDN